MPGFDAATTRRLDILCKTLRARHGLGQEFHAALYARMDAMLTGYLRGHAPVTPDEAFLLVEQSFDDAASVSDLAAAITAEPKGAPSLGRRIALAIIAAASVGAAMKLTVLSAGAVLVLAMRPDRNTLSAYGALGSMIQLGCVFTTVVVFGLLLYRWQRSMQIGDPPGALTLASLPLALWALLAFAAMLVVPHVKFPVGGIAANNEWVFRLGYPIFYFVVSVVDCLIWTRWCDAAPRRVGAIAAGIGSWLAWSVVTSLLYLLVGYVMIDYTYDAQPSGYNHVVEIFQFTPTGLPLAWDLFVARPVLGIANIPAVAAQAPLIAAAVLAAGIYALFLRRDNE